MLKLKDLCENFDLAYEALGQYDYDVEKTKKVIKYYRINSNAIYPFYNKEGLNFLRLAKTTERDFEQSVAEIKLIQHLKSKGVQVLEVQPMRDGNEIKVLNTAYGKYIVCAFKKVQGISLEDYFEENEVTKDLIRGYGEALGKMHKATEGVNNLNRINYLNYINKIESRLNNLCENEFMKNEFYKLKEKYLSLDITPNNFGLIHYDAELDNVFYDKKVGFIFIDFDDSHYNFYCLDIARSLNEVERIAPSLMDTFLDGYRMHKDLDNNINYEFFKKISFMDQYAEIHYVLSENVENRPDWMNEIIDELLIMKQKYEEYFKR